MNKNDIKHYKAVVSQMRGLVHEFETLVKELQPTGAKTMKTPAQVKGRTTAKTAKPPKPSKPSKPTKAVAKEIPQRRIAAQAAKPVPAKKSVAVSGNEVTLNVGVFAVRALAEADATELLNTRGVFERRSVIFPNPRQYKVVPTVQYARVVQLGKRFEHNPWGVNVTISVAGEDTNAKAWINATLSRCKAFQER